MLSFILQQLKQTINDILLFLKNPQDKYAAELETGNKLKTLLVVLCISLTLSCILGLAIQMLAKTGWYDSDNHAVGEMQYLLGLDILYLNKNGYSQCAESKVSIS